MCSFSIFTIVSLTFYPCKPYSQRSGLVASNSSGQQTASLALPPEPLRENTAEIVMDAFFNELRARATNGSSQSTTLSDADTCESGDDLTWEELNSAIRNSETSLDQSQSDLSSGARSVGSDADGRTQGNEVPRPSVSFQSPCHCIGVD